LVGPLGPRESGTHRAQIVHRASRCTRAAGSPSGDRRGRL